MADTKISALTGGNPAQSGDLVPIDRSGANFSISAGSIATLQIWTEGEVDFGSTPIRDTNFTITDAAITATGKVIVQESGKIATSRVAAGDAQWDSISFAALPTSGSATVYALASGPVVGKRKFQYTVVA